MKLNLLSAILLLNAFVLAAQPTPDRDFDPSGKKGVITGKVTDKDSGVPMEYTSIAVFSLKDSSLLTGTVSDVSGNFIIENIPYGRYYIEIQFIGYDKQVLSPVLLNPEQPENNLGGISLSINSNNLDEVEVVAQQRRVEYRIDKKVVNVSEDLNAAGGTAVDVLENTPSVTVDIEGNVSMRGSGTFTVLINGKPTVLEGSDALRQIPATTIQNIEIITNPSVKYDPDGNAGIINVVLKKQVESGTTGIINASVGLNHKYRLDALINRRIGKLNYFIGGNYSDNQHLGTLNREHITTTEDSKHYNIAEGGFDFLRGGSQLKGGFDYDLSPKTNLAFEASGGTYSFGIDRTNNSYEYTIPSTVEAYYVNSDISDNQGYYYNANLNLSHNFDSSDHKIVVMANYSQRTSDDTENLEYFVADENFNIIPTELPELTRNLETGNSNEYRLQVDYTKPIGNGKLEAGYQGRLDDNLDDFLFQEYDPDTEEWNSIGENSSEISFFRNIQSAYVQYGGKLNKLQYQIGLRGEYTYRLIEYQNFNKSYEINRLDYYPTVHLSREFEKDQQLMLSYSKRVNRPRSYWLDSIPSYIDKQTIRIGNPGLEPEYINSLELGYQKGWDRNFLAFEAYYRNTTNLITRVTDYDEEAGIFYQRAENINEDHVLGTELMLNWQIAKWFNLNASTTGYYYRIMGELYGESIDNSNFSWNANANATFTYSKTGRIQANMAYRGPQVTAQGSSAGMYYMNLAVRQDFFKRKLSATLQVRDLFGTMKRDFTASGVGFEQHIVMQREPRVLMLTLSYKINNYRVDPAQSRRQGDEGVDMDAGF